MITHKLRLIIHVVVIAVISTYFWTQSRYPDLNRKAMMAKNASVADTISMYPIFEIKPSDPIPTKILYTTVNWVNDNKKGMTFGVIIGALFLSLIGYLRFKPSENRLVSALYGTILGSPLGVCVNCAAPIFKGVLHSKQIEFSFAMMLSSPTMNMIVLTMVFSLFPFYMAMTKVVFTLLVIFVVVPVFSKWMDSKIKIKGFEALAAKGPSFSFQVSPVMGFSRELIEVVKDFWRAFSFLAIRTVPLMFVAGFLGAILSHMIPFERIGADSGPLTIVIAAAVGLFLPVPMAFDVVLTNALFVGGLSPGLALVLLCTLGIFSSYSFMIVWTSASKKWAMLLAGAIFVMGSAVGFMGNTLDRIFYLEPNIRDYQAMRHIKTAQGPTQGAQSQGPLLQANAAKSELYAKATQLQKTLVYEATEGPMLKVYGTPFAQKSAATGRFEKHEGVALGLEQGFVYGIRDYPDPFWIGRGTASGDFNGDGWLDVVFGSDSGPKLYVNQGGRFRKVEGFLPTMDDKRVYAVAFIDWDNDGWLDLFMTTFHRGNYVARNDKGVFLEPTLVPNGQGIITVSPSFADLNGDGWLDVFNGNMSLGIITGFRAYGSGRQNSITFQVPEKKPELTYREQILDVIDGETMATLATDVNDDGHIDLYAGNDFVVPDYWFLGGPGGSFEFSLKEPLSQLPTPFYSMSADSGDLNNDLKTDFIMTGTVQMARGIGTDVIDGRSPFDYTRRNDTAEVCERIDQKLFRDSCLLNRKTDHLIPFYKNRNLNIRDCLVLTDNVAKEDCLLSVMWMIVTSNVNIKDCREEFHFDQKILDVCEIFKKAGVTKLSKDFEAYAPQNDEPTLYLGEGGGRFQRQHLAHPGGWTWSTKFADLDQDGYLDIFNAEGVVREGGFGFNVLMHNQLGKSGKLDFVQRQFSWNLVDPFYLFSFTFIDYDHDGDLDIIGNSSIGPVQVYENRLNDNNAVAFGLKLSPFNTQGVSARLTIEDESGQKQVQEIKAGGGYQSFDAPRVYFGLGQKKSIRRVTINLQGWVKTVEGPFVAGHFYEIEAQIPNK